MSGKGCLSNVSRRTVLRGLISTGGAAVAARFVRARSALAATRGGKLRVWMQQSWTKAVDDYVGSVFKEWGGKNGVEVEYSIVPGADRAQRLAAALEGGAAPDIAVLWDDVQYYRGHGNLVEVTEVINKFKNAAGGIYKGALDAVGDEHNRYWAVPVAINPWVVHTRVDLLEKAKLDYPKTWDEFIEACKKLQGPPALYGYGMALGRCGDTNYNFSNLLWCYGGKLQTKESKPAYNSEAMLKTIQIVSDMFKVHKIIPPGAVTWDDSGNNKAYQSEQAVFVINPTSLYSWLQKNKPELAARTGLFRPPVGPAGTFGQVEIVSFAIFNQSKNQEAAKEALAYFITPDAQQKMAEMGEHHWAPIYKERLHTDYWTKDPLYRAYIDIVDHGFPPSYEGVPVPAFSELMSTFKIADMLQDVVLRDQSPAQVLAEFVKKADAVYAKYKS
jgi:multiple sugar transport system substrate-binding protein